MHMLRLAPYLLQSEELYIVVLGSSGPCCNPPVNLVDEKDQRTSTERTMKETVDEMISAFDRHLEDSAASVKQQFRWMKRRYREKVDVNRVASRIELKAREG